ncbi:MAG: DUF86 domain-containing protein [Nitrospirae bacterium]|nr:DUF86 domain-containing protein [Nitrospirota bacterium]
MLDRERILSKIDQLDQYLGELSQVVPASFPEYQASVEKRRACERLLQLCIECVLDICTLLVSGLRLGLPGDEDDLFEKLERAKVLSPQILALLRPMKGFRNILVHEYGGIDDAVVYKIAMGRLRDLETFKQAVRRVLQDREG